MASGDSGWKVLGRVPTQCFSSFLGPTLFLLYINDFPDDVVCDTSIYAVLSTISVIKHLIELIFELESDQHDTLDWDRKRLVDFNARKTQLVLFDRSNDSGAIMSGPMLLAATWIC